MKTPTLYHPAMKLVRESTGLFLYAVTYVANSCIKADGYSKGTPAGTVVLPEALPIVLNLKNEGDICLPVITPVTHKVPITEKELAGRFSIVGFSVLNGAVLGASSIPVDVESLKSEITTKGAGDPTTAGVMPWPGMFVL